MTEHAVRDTGPHLVAWGLKWLKYIVNYYRNNSLTIKGIFLKFAEYRLYDTNKISIKSNIFFENKNVRMQMSLGVA